MRLEVNMQALKTQLKLAPAAEEESGEEKRQGLGGAELGTARPIQVATHWP